MANFKNEAENRVLNSVLEARRAASELGQGVLVHILNMALIEMGADAVREFHLETMAGRRAALGEQSPN